MKPVENNARARQMIDMVQFCELAASGATVQEAARQLGLTELELRKIADQNGIAFASNPISETITITKPSKVRAPSMKPKHVAHSRRGVPNPNPISVTPLSEMDKMRAAFDNAMAPYIPEKPARKPRTYYDPSICEIVIEKAWLGHTLGATCAFIGCARGTFTEWASTHPELGAAVARAKAIRQSFYEGHLIDMVRRGGDSTRMSAVKLGLLNVGGEDWKERLTADHNVTFSLAGLIQESMKVVGQTIEGTAVEQIEVKPDCSTE